MKNCELELKIGYEFKNEELIERALTHSSFNREKNTQHHDNERLEFLGDAFLDAVIGAELYQKMEGVTEGRLTKLRSQIVCEASLANIAREINLGDYLYMGFGEIQAGGRNKDSILADAIEAVLGAVYLDSNYETVRDIVLKLFGNTIEDAIKGKLFRDYKSELQEILQKKGKITSIVYIMDHEEGPPHDRTFYVHMECDGVKYASGKGKSKKDAEQEAAKETLYSLGRGDN